MKAILLVLLACLTPCLAAQGEESQIRTYDLSWFLSADMEPLHRVDVRPHLDSSFWEPELYDTPLEEMVVPGAREFADIVFDVLDTTLIGTACEVEVDRGRMRVSGPAEAHARVRRMLEQVAEEVLRSVVVDVFLVPGSKVPANTPTLLDAVQAERLLVLTGAELQGTDISRMGQRLVLGLESDRASVTDLGVAHFRPETEPSDPIVGVLKEGNSVGAIVQQHPNGRLWIRAWGRNGEVLSNERNTDVSGLGGIAINITRQRSSLFIASGLIVNGGALLLGSDRSPAGMWLVRARLSRTPPPRPALFAAAEDSVWGQLIPLGALTAPPMLSQSPYRVSGVSPSGGLYPLETWNEELLERQSVPGLDTGDLADSLRSVTEEQSTSGCAHALGNSLWVHGSPSYLAAAEAQVDELRSIPGRGYVQLELRYGVLPRSVSEPIAMQAEGEAMASMLAAAEGSHRVLLSGRAGDNLCFGEGVDQTYIKDLDVEVSMSLGYSCIVNTHHAGVSLTCRASPMPDRRMSAWYELQVREAGVSRKFNVVFWEEARRLGLFKSPKDAGTPDPEVRLELPSSHPAALSGVQVFTPGEWTPLGSCRLGKTDRLLVAVMRLVSY